MFVKNKEGLRSSEIFLKFFDGYVAMNDFFVSLQQKKTVGREAPVREAP